MTAQVIADDLRPSEALDALMARHGVLRVVLALPMAVIRRRRVVILRHDALSGHLQRDIGLRDHSPPKQLWEYR